MLCSRSIRCYGIYFDFDYYFPWVFLKDVGGLVGCIANSDLICNIFRFFCRVLFLYNHYTQVLVHIYIFLWFGSSYLPCDRSFDP